MRTFYFFKGRVALYAILKALSIKPGDEIILPGFTCIVVANAIIYLGATPIYVDIDPDTYNIDTDRIEEKITDKTKGIVAQHTFGIPADMDRITEIAKKYSLYVIEDSCHAIGSTYKGREVGTFGDASFFSSQWSKPVTTGLGGWAVINNKDLLEKMESVYPEFSEPSYKESLLLRLEYMIYSGIIKPSLFWVIQGTYRWLSSAGLIIGSSSNEELKCKMPTDFAKRMSNWQMELLERKLAVLKIIIMHRKWVASLYESSFKEMGIKPVEQLEECNPVYLRYPILVKNKKKILEEARKKRIELGDWFISPVHDRLIDWEKVYYKKGMCPIAEKICEHIINLPTHQGIGPNDVDSIIAFLDHQEICSYDRNEGENVLPSSIQG